MQVVPIVLAYRVPLLPAGSPTTEFPGAAMIEEKLAANEYSTPATRLKEKPPVETSQVGGIGVITGTAGV